MPRSQLRKNLLILAIGLLAALDAWAVTVYVTSISATQVQIIVDGKAVRTLRVGETSPEGVRLLEIRGNVAVLETGGRAMSMTIGQSTVAQTQFQADQRGQFMVRALVNGVAATAMIDTGASSVTLNVQQAGLMGIDYRRGQRTTTYTANGPAAAYMVTLASVQVGEVILANIPALVIDGGPEKLPIALIGMSFLKHVEMRRSGNTMTLSRPHRQ